MGALLQGNLSFLRFVATCCRPPSSVMESNQLQSWEEIGLHVAPYSSTSATVFPAGRAELIQKHEAIIQQYLQLLLHDVHLQDSPLKEFLSAEALALSPFLFPVRHSENLWQLHLFLSQGALCSFLNSTRMLSPKDIVHAEQIFVRPTMSTCIDPMPQQNQREVHIQKLQGFLCTCSRE